MEVEDNTMAFLVFRACCSSIPYSCGLRNYNHESAFTHIGTRSLKKENIFQRRIPPLQSILSWQLIQNTKLCLGMFVVNRISLCLGTSADEYQTLTYISIKKNSSRRRHPNHIMILLNILLHST